MPRYPVRETSLASVVLRRKVKRVVKPIRMTRTAGERPRIQTGPETLLGLVTPEPTKHGAGKLATSFDYVA